MARMPSSPRKGEHARPTVRAAGVTLVELSATLAVLSLLVAIGMPSLQKLRMRQQVNATMHLLVSHFASARMTAISQGVPVVVCPGNGGEGCREDSNWGDHWLSFRDPDGNRKPDEGIDIYRNDPVPQDPRIRILSTQGRRHVRYQSSGFSYGTNLTVRVCYEGRVAGSVVLNNTGRARTVRGDLSIPC